VTWKTKALRAIREARKEAPDLRGKELDKFLRPFYPFGPRQYHPYKAWRQACREVCYPRFPSVTENTKVVDVDCPLFEEKT